MLRYFKRKTTEVVKYSLIERHYYNKLLFGGEHFASHIKPFLRYHNIKDGILTTNEPFTIYGFHFDNRANKPQNIPHFTQENLLSLKLDDPRILAGLINMSLIYGRCYISMDINLEEKKGTPLYNLVNDFIAYNRKKLKLEQIYKAPEESRDFPVVFILSLGNPFLAIQNSLSRFRSWINKNYITDKNYNQRSPIGKAFSRIISFLGNSTLLTTKILSYLLTAIVWTMDLLTAAFIINPICTILAPISKFYDTEILKPILKDQILNLREKLFENEYFKQHASFYKTLPHSDIEPKYVAPSQEQKTKKSKDNKHSSKFNTEKETTQEIRIDM